MSDIVSSSLKTVAKGTALILSSIVIGAAFWFATKVIIARVVTAEEFGVYSLAFALVSVVSLVSSLGIQEGITRYVSVYLGEGRKGDAEGISNAAIQMGLVSGAAFFLLMFLGAGFLARHVFYKPEVESSFRIISIVIPASALSQILGGILRGKNIVKPRAYFIDIGHPLYFLLFLALFFLMGLPFISVIYAYSIATVLVLASIALYAYRIGELGFLSIKNGSHYKKLIGFSISLSSVNVMALAMTWADTLMLGRYASAGDVGIYNIGASLARLLTFPLAALMFVFMPIAGEMYVKRQFKELNRTYQVLTKWLFFAILPVFFVLFFFPEMAITFLFGGRFTDAALSLRILSVGFLLNAFFGANSTVLIAAGKSDVIMKISFIGTALNIVLNYVFIKQFGMGMAGAALATMVSYLLIGILCAIVLHGEMKIHPMTSGYLRPVVASAVMGLILYAVVKHSPFFMWMMPVYLLLFIGGYFASLLLTRSLDSEDIAMLDAVIARTGLQMDVVKRIARRYSSGTERHKEP